MKHIMKCGLCVALLMTALSGNSGVITFDDTTDVDAVSWSDLNPSYQDLDGFRFAAQNYGNISYFNVNAYGLNWDYNDTDHISSAGNLLTVSRIDGGDFSFLSLAIGTGNTSVYTLNFYGLKDGETVHSYSYQAPAGSGFSGINWQMVNFSGFEGIDTLQVNVPAASYSFLFDDMTVEAIPEPATALSLMLGGLVIAGYRRVRKVYGC